MASPTRLQAEELIASFREAVLQASDLHEVTALLAAIRQVETEAETRRLEVLVVADRETLQGPDAILDSDQAASFLGESLNWVYHHRRQLRPALVSAEGSRPRYSRSKLEVLQENWSGNGEGK